MLVNEGRTGVAAGTRVRIAVRSKELLLSLIKSHFGSAQVLVMKLAHIVVVPWPRLVVVAKVLWSSLNGNALFTVTVLGIIKTRARGGSIFLRVDKRS